MALPEAERRETSRLSLRIPVRVHVNDPGPDILQCESINLSRRGLCFLSDRPLVIGSTVQVMLQMPREIIGQRPTEMVGTARVVHVHPSPIPGGRLRVGVRFEQLDPMVIGEPPPA